MVILRDHMHLILHYHWGQIDQIVVVLAYNGKVKLTRL